MKINITTLSENTATGYTIAEGGLSILVEADGTTILFDTGASFSAVYNAQLLGVDLATVDHIVLSHGHQDHTGGLREVLKRKGNVGIIAHPDIWTLKYARRSRKHKERYVGIPFSREELESRGADFTLVREPLHITGNVLTSGEVPMISGYETIEDNLLVKENGGFRQDKLADDMALAIDTDFGLVVILGCAHRGIINTVRHVQQIAGKELVHTVIGGTHLIRASEERLEKTITDLRDIGIQRLGVSHCTGFHASSRMAQEFGDVFFLNNAGARLTLP